MLFGQIVWNPEITTGSISLIVTIVGASVALGWWFTRQFTAAQVLFNSLQKDLTVLQSDFNSFKIAQTAQFAAINIELKQQTEILRKQDVLTERMSSETKRTDKIEITLERLEREFSMFRVGSRVSEQRQVGG